MEENVTTKTQDGYELIIEYVTYEDIQQVKSQMFITFYLLYLKSFIYMRIFFIKNACPFHIFRSES